MSAPPVDVAILGGGCAGLSLAAALAGCEQRIAVVEPRTAFRRDRTWCYWDVTPHAFESAVAHRWSRWKLRHRGRDLVHAAPGVHYCEVPADAFYAEALDRLAAAPNVELCLGARATSVRELPDGVEIETDRGALRAGRVFDGRPPPRSPDPHGLLQHFAGLHVRTEQPAFDPGVVTLMDFDVDQTRGIHFFYVLPYDRDRALVEATFLSPEPLPEEHYLEAIDRYLAERHGVRAYKTEDRERGVIPMSARRPPAAIGRIVPIGTLGGLVRPSTGYAFLAIQRFSRAFAAALARDADAAPPRRGGGGAASASRASAAANAREKRWIARNA